MFAGMVLMTALEPPVPAPPDQLVSSFQAVLVPPTQVVANAEPEKQTTMAVTSEAPNDWLRSCEELYLGFILVFVVCESEISLRSADR